MRRRARRPTRSRSCADNSRVPSPSAPPPPRASRRCPRWCCNFAGNFPTVRVNIVERPLPYPPASLRNGTMDLAIGPVPAAGLDADLHSEPLMYNGSRGRTQRTPVGAQPLLADLVESEWVVTGPSTQGPAPRSSMHSAARARSPRRIIQCDITWTLAALLSEATCCAHCRCNSRAPAVRPVLQTQWRCARNCRATS